MIDKIQKALRSPSKVSEKDVLTDFAKDLPQDQTNWLAGYFAGQADVNLRLADIFQKLGRNGDIETEALTAQVTTNGFYLESSIHLKKLTVLYGSHSGNGSGFTKKVKEYASSKGYEVNLVNMNKYKARELKNEKNLLIIVSTHGEGEPPMAAEELYEFIHSKRAPKLDDLQYSVLALGDKSYIQFCKIGIDFDKKLAELGAKRISPRVDCDLNFKADASRWLEDSINEFDKLNGETKALVNGVAVNDEVKVTEQKNGEENPFKAEIIKRVNLNGRGSNKETYHVELSIEDSGLDYKPGDSVGVIASNPERLVNEILEVTGFDEHVKVNISAGKLDLKDALLNHLEITVITPDVVKKHNQFARSKELDKLFENAKDFKEFIFNNDVVDLLLKYPVKYSPEEFVSILRELLARLYSISSSPSAYENEVHLTVGALRYSSNGRDKQGCCSTYISDQVEEGENISIYIKPNEGFRLPDNPEIPIIMVGAGTGIAPYRSFIDERAATEAKGNNWLIFGDQHFTTDFLYQTEWQEHLKSGVLTHMDVAFSRDQKKKVYVQHKIKDKSKEIFDWLQNNAVIYVCGDMHKMAKDVQAAFLNIIKNEGGLSIEDAEKYLKNLRREGRYQEDVY